MYTFCATQGSGSGIIEIALGVCLALAAVSIRNQKKQSGVGG